MENQELRDKGWVLVTKASEVCKPLLWLRDTDYAFVLAPSLKTPLQSALYTVSEFPDAILALCRKVDNIYTRALEKPWVGIGAQERSSRVGKRTAEIGLMRALDFAREQ